MARARASRVNGSRRSDSVASNTRRPSSWFSMWTDAVSPGVAAFQVALVHAQERETCSSLAIPPCSTGPAVVADDVGAALAPRVLVTSATGGQPLVAVEAVVEADRVEAVAEGAQVGQQPDRPVGRRAGAPRHQRADLLVERNGGVAEVVLAAEAHEPGAARQQPAGDEVRQLAQVEVGQGDPVGELLLAHREAPVAHRAGVDRAGGPGGALTPRPLEQERPARHARRGCR